MVHIPGRTNPADFLTRQRFPDGQGPASRTGYDAVTIRSLPLSSGSTLLSPTALAPPLPLPMLAPALTHLAFCTPSLPPHSGRRCPWTPCWAPSLPQHKPRLRLPNPSLWQAPHYPLRTPRIADSSGGTVYFTAEARREVTACAYPTQVIVACRSCENSMRRRWVATLAATKPSRWPAARYGGQPEASPPTLRSSSRHALRASASKRTTYHHLVCSSLFRCRHAGAAASALTSSNYPRPALVTTSCRCTSTS